MAYHIVWDNVTKVQSDVGGVEMPWVAFPKNPGSEAVSGGFLYIPQKGAKWQISCRKYGNMHICAI